MSEATYTNKRRKLSNPPLLLSPSPDSYSSEDPGSSNPEDDVSPFLHHQGKDTNSNNNNHHIPSVRGGADSSSSVPFNDPKDINAVSAGRLEELKQQEALLAAQLAAVRREKLTTLQSRPLTIGIVGFGRFGQFIAKAFCKHGHNVVVTSRSDYTEIANSMGATYVPLSSPQVFVEGAGRSSGLDVIVFCVSILSFEETVESLVPYIEASMKDSQTSDARGPLVVDVLSVKEHPRKVLLNLLPSQVDLLLTHPMFGPDSGKNGWHGLNFVYEKTRINGVLLDQEKQQYGNLQNNTEQTMTRFVDGQTGQIHSVHENSEAHVEAVDRMERFLSIWEEEGCHMVQMSCREHDAYAANSQFITHLMGRILGSHNKQEGLKKTPIDTSGFRNVLKLVESTTADSFDLFYGLYKFNTNSADTITNLQSAMTNVVQKLRAKEQQEEEELALRRQQRREEKLAAQQQQKTKT